jgi:hypothetical protein
MLSLSYGSLNRSPFDKRKTGTLGGRAGLDATSSSLRGVFAAPFVPRIVECADDRIYLSQSFVNDGDL